MLSDERAMTQFDANLPLAGIIAIEVQIKNPTTEARDMHAVRFRLRDSESKIFKPIAPKEALKRVMKYYGVRTYSKESYRRTQESYQSLALTLKGKLLPQQERRGMLFFDVRRSTTDLSKFMLMLEGRPI